MRNSAHYLLRLPERDDQYNIDDFNGNFTAIDKAMSDNASAAEESMRAVSEEAEARGKADADERAARERAVGDLDSALSAHKGDKVNPHSVTKAQVGLGSVDNKSSETIRGEITAKNVTDALGYTPAKTSDVPGAQFVFDAVRPVGSTYVQFPQQEEPNALFNKNGVTSTWAVINYDGAFFRAQGTGAENFIDKNGVLKKQGGAVPNIKGSIISEHSNRGDVEYSASEAFKGSSVFDVGRTGSNDGSYHTGIKINFSAADSNGLYKDNSEVRPENYTIRVWKRTA